MLFYVFYVRCFKPSFYHTLFSNFFLPLLQDYSISEWLNKGASKEKLVVGFPTYGRSFTLASPNLTDVNAPAIKGGNAGKFTKETGFLAFFEVYGGFLPFLGDLKFITFSFFSF